MIPFVEIAVTVITRLHANDSIYQACDGITSSVRNDAFVFNSDASDDLFASHCIRNICLLGIKFISIVPCVLVGTTFTMTLSCTAVRVLFKHRMTGEHDENILISIKFKTR